MDREICRQILIGIVCNLLVIDSGLQEGWSTPTITKFNNNDPLEVTEDEVAWIVNLMYVGVGIGSTIPFFLMDRIGRKSTLLVAAIPKILSWILIGLATNLTTIIVGRIFAGIGCGVTYAVMPMYLGEVSSKRSRGPLGTMMAVLMNIGMLLIYAIGSWVSRLVMAAIAIWVPIAFIVTFMWMPESSVFLTKKNKLTSAEKTLQWVLAKDDVNEELEEIKRIVADEEQCVKLTLMETFKEICRRSEYRRAFGIMLILFSALTLTGAAPILAYQSFLLKEAGVEMSPNLGILITGCTIVIAGTICVTLVKATGKRSLLLISTPACVLSLTGIAIFFTLLSAGYDSVSRYAWVFTVLLVIYVLAYGLALNPVPLAYAGEIFPLNAKVAGAIFCSLYYAISTTTIVKYYQIMQDTYGPHVPLWTFTVITFFIWILIVMYVPETEGKTLEEVQIELKRKK